ncbi:hypothetical protein NVP1259O_20 [Vibrio phage 1.259.O._10N.286.48.F4]|nr:hypothetical protein NVP1259O_20 [Vibrio phage 1.259.O._10N.286.48.F4]
MSLKESLTGYLDHTLEGGKLENLIYTQQGSVEYLPNFGIDRNTFVDSSYAIQSTSFSSYIRQMAMINNILTESITVENYGFTQNILYKIADDNSQSNNSNGGLISV